MNAILSVIIPVYNTEKYINRCLNSIINQTYQNLEIIIVDDGSTDSSFLICKEKEKEDSRVVVVCGDNKGVSSARNCGMRIANGEYITFVDSDDYLEYDAYEKALKNIGDCDAIFFGYYEEYEDIKCKTSISPSQKGITSSYEAIYNCMLPNRNCYFTSVWNKIFKKEKIFEVSFDSSFVMGEDEVWVVQSIMKLSKIMLYNEPLYNYVQRPGSALHSNKRTTHNWLSHVLAKEKVLQLVSDDKEHYNSIVAKEYNDLFYLVVHSYVADSYPMSKLVYNRIKKYREQFFLSKNYSYKRKIKILLIHMAIQLKMPKIVIDKLWNFSILKTKLIITKQQIIDNNRRL